MPPPACIGSSNGLLGWQDARILDGYGCAATLAERVRDEIAGAGELVSAPSGNVARTD